MLLWPNIHETVTCFIIYSCFQKFLLTSLLVERQPFFATGIFVRVSCHRSVTSFFLLSICNCLKLVHNVLFIVYSTYIFKELFPLLKATKAALATAAFLCNLQKFMLDFDALKTWLRPESMSSDSLSWIRTFFESHIALVHVVGAVKSMTKDAILVSNLNF